MVNSNEFIELIEMDNNVYCCICLNTDGYIETSTLKERDDYIFIKMDCCNQQIHKNCFLDWIVHPIKTNKKYDNKFHCIICKTKIVNLQNIISLGDFINYIENTQNTLTNPTIFHYKKLISELYNHSIMSIILNSEDENKGDTDLKYFFYNVCFIFIFLIMVFVFIFIINLL
jgi:hypothetical protein